MSGRGQRKKAGKGIGKGQSVAKSDEDAWKVDVISYSIIKKPSILSDMVLSMTWISHNELKSHRLAWAWKAIFQKFGRCLEGSAGWFECKSAHDANHKQFLNKNETCVQSSAYDGQL